MKLCIDLCCGLGGWTEGFLSHGFTCVGFDIKKFDYPGQLVIQDIRTLHGSQFSGATVIVASAPCEEFSRHDMPWTRKKNPPPPDLSLVEACFRIAEEAGVPIIMENVRGAQRFIGRAAAHWGPFYLWGDVPAIMPGFAKKKTKESYGPSLDRPSIRAKIPFELANFIASVYS